MISLSSIACGSLGLGWDTIERDGEQPLRFGCKMIALEPALKTSPMGAAIRRRPLSQFLSRASQAIGLRGEVSVLLTGDERIRALNRDFRGKNQATDVLSFPPAPPFSEGGQAGDLAISLDAALRQAVERGHTLQLEVQVLMLHGLLHLAGFDHETDSGEMARRENRLRKQLALPPGLIERGDSQFIRIPSPSRKSGGTKMPNRRHESGQKLSRESTRASVKSKGPRP